MVVASGLLLACGGSNWADGQCHLLNLYVHGEQRNPPGHQGQEPFHSHAASLDEHPDHAGRGSVESAGLAFRHPVYGPLATVTDSDRKCHYARPWQPLRDHYDRYGRAQR